MAINIYDDNEFFRMTDAIDRIAADAEGWKIKTYHSKEKHDFKRKASVIQFDGRITITVDFELWRKAERGCRVCNFILAHEMGHLVLNHHAKNAVRKHFQLFEGPNGMSNIPPTLEEYETNMSAVFFQCGVALEDARWSSDDLARRAFSDRLTIGKAQNLLRLEVFQKELIRQRSRHSRVVF